MLRAEAEKVDKNYGAWGTQLMLRIEAKWTAAKSDSCSPIFARTWERRGFPKLPPQRFTSTHLSMNDKLSSHLTTFLLKMLFTAVERVPFTSGKSNSDGFSWDSSILSIGRRHHTSICSIRPAMWMFVANTFRRSQVASWMLDAWLTSKSEKIEPP